MSNPIEHVLMLKCTCTRCGHEWITRTGNQPRVCPNCTSPYWDRPRQSEKKEGENNGAE